MTLTICENIYGYKIGGYSQIAWNLNSGFNSDV